MTVVESVVAEQKPATTKAVVAKPIAKTPTKTVVQAAAKTKMPKAPVQSNTKVATKATVKATPSSKTSVAKPAVRVPPTKAAKLKKPKMTRDSFTFPKAEYAVLESLKSRAAKLGSPAKKTELLRAGIKAIAAMQDAAFVAALKSVPSLKTGRPAKAR
jgi:hypothetical protein